MYRAEELKNFVSSGLGINPEDSEIAKEKILNYFNGNDIQQEDQTKIAKLKETIYPLFKKEK